MFKTVLIFFILGYFGTIKSSPLINRPSDVDTITDGNRVIDDGHLPTTKASPLTVQPADINTISDGVEKFDDPRTNSAETERSSAVPTRTDVRDDPDALYAEILELLSSDIDGPSSDLIGFLADIDESEPIAPERAKRDLRGAFEKIRNATVHRLKRLGGQLDKVKEYAPVLIELLRELARILRLIHSIYNGTYVPGDFPYGDRPGYPYQGRGGPGFDLTRPNGFYYDKFIDDAVGNKIK